MSWSMLSASDARYMSFLNPTTISSAIPVSFSSCGSSLRAGHAGEQRVNMGDVDAVARLDAVESRRVVNGPADSAAIGTGHRDQHGFSVNRRDRDAFRGLAREGGAGKPRPALDGAHLFADNARRCIRRFQLVER